MSKKYTLNIGCHQPGRITSRDSETRQFDTLEEAKQSINSSVASWRRFGYSLWFATITDPDGKEVYRK